MDVKGGIGSGSITNGPEIGTFYKNNQDAIREANDLMDANFKKTPDGKYCQIGDRNCPHLTFETDKYIQTGKKGDWPVQGKPLNREQMSDLYRKRRWGIFSTKPKWYGEGAFYELTRSPLTSFEGLSTQLSKYDEGSTFAVLA